MFQRGGNLNFFHQNRHLAHRALDAFDKKAFDELGRCSGRPDDPFAGRR